MGSHLLGPAAVSGHPCSYQRSRVTRLVCGITEGGWREAQHPAPCTGGRATPRSLLTAPVGCEGI